MADPRDESEEDEDYDPAAEAAAEEAEPPARKKPRRSRFVDDEAGVDDGDDDDDDGGAAGGGGGARAGAKKGGRADKGGRAGRSRFIDDEVEVEDEDDEDDEDEDDDDELAPDDDDEALDNDKIRRQNEELRRKQREEDIAKLEQEVNERYLNNQQRARYPAEEASRGPRDEIRRHAELPGMADPKLFLLRCKAGHEHEIVIFMMTKFINHAGTAEPLSVTSCVATAIRGYVYVEAFKEAHVRAAVQQIRHVYQSTLKLVPLGEMTEVLRMPSKAERTDARLVVGSWVRLKRPAEYKGDLAAVVSIDEVQATGEVTVRCIPRLDYTLLARDPADEPARRKASARPAARLFSVAEAQNAGFEPYALERGAKHTAYALERPREYGGLRFEDGFLIKTVKLAFVSADASPTADEVEVFRAMLASVGKEGESAALLQGMERAVRAAVQTTFAAGDTVRVVEGELLGLTCTVVRVHADGGLSCQPHHEGLAQAVELKASQLAKHFRMGDHCQVLRGQFAGETGLIVALSAERVTLFSDLSKKELVVRPDDLTEAAEVSAGRETLGAFALHDLVGLDQSSAGVVVKVEHSSFKVLSTSGTLRTVALHEMGRKRSSRGAVALDANSQLISAGDVLTMADPLDARQGVVLHLFKSFLFLHAREQTEHAGVFVVRARQTRLVDSGGAGGGASAKPRAAPPGPSYGLALGDGGAALFGGAAGGGGGRGWGADGGRGGGGGGRGFGGGGRGRFDELQSAYVRIQAGPYKGMYGTVKSATDGVARVELTAKSKVVTMAKDKLLIVQRAGEAHGGGGGGGGPAGGLGGGLGGGFGGGALGGGGGGAFGLGLPTPLRDDGFRTPMRDGSGGLYPSTPMRDAMPMTPMRDGELGGADGARASDPWDPTKTPAHDPWANLGARTPSHSAAWGGAGGASDAVGGGGGHDEYAGLGLAPHWPPRSSDGLADHLSASHGGGGSAAASGSQPAWQPQPSAQQPTHWAHGRAPPPPPPSGAPPPPPPPAGGPPAAYAAYAAGGVGGSAQLEPDEGAAAAAALAALPCDIAVHIVGGAHAGSAGHIAQVRGARGDVYSVVLVAADGARLVECARRELEPTTPGKKDAIVILHGDLLHSTGVLIGVDGTDGIIKMDTTNDIKIVELRSCAKLVRV